MVAVSVSPEEYARLEAILTNSVSSKVPLKLRFRALFSLKSLKTDEAVDIIAKAFSDPSALLRHELAYVLGQMKNPHAIPVLNTVLANKAEDEMVRHEAAEALGAIGSESSVETLKMYLTPDQEESRTVRETVELALARIEYEVAKKNSSGNIADDFAVSGYMSIDPAPALENATKVTSTGARIKAIPTKELGRILMDPKLSMFERYKAMFALRNRGDEESVLELAKGFADDSALFRHEVAYVFGQMQHAAAVPSLVERLSNEGEAAMVRHEAAEALGSIATEECFAALERFKADEKRVVRESCLVGLDMAEFEVSGEFQYAEKVVLG